MILKIKNREIILDMESDEVTNILSSLDTEDLQQIMQNIVQQYKNIQDLATLVGIISSILTQRLSN